MKKLLVWTAMGLCLSGSLQANHIDFVVDGGFFLATDSLSGPALPC